MTEEDHVCRLCGHHLAYHRQAMPVGACIDCECPGYAIPETVKRASLWDGIIETYQTETEMNGFRATQGALL